MAYLVEFAARAVRDLEILYVEKKAAESQAAARWYNGLEEAVYSVRIVAQRFLKPQRRNAMSATCGMGTNRTSIASFSRSTNGNTGYGFSQFGTAQEKGFGYPISQADCETVFPACGHIFVCVACCTSPEETDESIMKRKPGISHDASEGQPAQICSHGA
jgi:hypothetical protein